MRQIKNQRWRNWSGNQVGTPRKILYPNNEAELIALVKQAHAKRRTIRIAGTGHSWSPLIAGADYIVSLQAYKRIVGHDIENYTITCEAGAQLFDVAEYAERLGWSLLNISYLDVQTMGAILSTATHGCGKQQPILAEHIVQCRLINGSGEIVELKQDDADFAAVKAGLGLLGLVATVTVRCQVKVNIKLKKQILSYIEWQQRFTSLQNDYDFTHIFWMPYINKVCAIIAEAESNIQNYSISNDRSKQAKFIPWLTTCLQRLATHISFLTAYTNRLVFKLNFRNEKYIGKLQQVLSNRYHYTLYNCEYAFPIETGRKVITEIKRLTDKNKLFLPGPIEIRAIKADTNSLSFAYAEDVLAIGCSIASNAASSPKILFQLEKIFKHFRGRPHLVKIFSADYNYLKQVYPRLFDFQVRCEQYDPLHLFRTAALQKLLWGKAH